MNNNTALAPRQNNAAIATQRTLADLVAKNKSGLQQVAAENADIKRLYRIVLGCMTKTPAIANCTAESILRCMMDAAEVGMEPGGALGLAYLVPYGKECQFIIGYRGLIELARRTGLVRSVDAHAVYEGDVFEYEEGLTPILRHKPMAADRTPKNLTHVYAVARFKDGSAQADVMTKPDVDLIRARSKASSNGPWVTDYAEMAKKTVVRRLCKMLPRSIRTEQIWSRISAVEERNETNQSSIMLPSYSDGDLDDTADLGANEGNDDSAAATSPLLPLTDANTDDRDDDRE